MGDNQKQTYQFLPKAILVVIGVLLIGAAVIALADYLAEAWLEANAPPRFRDKVGNPVAEFTAITGLACPSDTEVLLSDDTHGGFNGDGTLCIAVRVRTETIEAWWADHPPWGAEEWKAGPVPTEIGSNCTSDERCIWLMTDDDGTWQYCGFQPTKELLESKGNRYAAEARGPRSRKWHNGNILVVDKEACEAWLYIWDM